VSRSPEARERDRERARRYRAANPEKAREAQSRYRAANREKLRERSRRSQAAARKANPAKERNGHLRRKHGLYPEDWEALRAAQGGCCYLCSEPLPGDPAEVATDHDHRCCGPEASCSRCRRGLAHPQCNTLIGLAGDDPGKLHRIADQLAEAQERLGDLAPPLTLFDLPDTGEDQ
jgi:hypothetical protein